jgi:hypothetical protein
MDLRLRGQLDTNEIEGLSDTNNDGITHGREVRNKRFGVIACCFKNDEGLVVLHRLVVR